MNTEPFGTVFKNGSATCLARIVGHDAQPIVPGDVAQIEYSVYLLDARDPDSRSTVAGHDGESLLPADVLFDTLVTDDLWTRDDVGYNFRHAMDVSTDHAFAIAGRDYLVEYRLSPYAGQVILARFRLHAI
jgi:hypothetical protein